MIRNIFLLAVFCAIVYGFGMDRFGLIDPDEPFYTLTAKEMLDARDPSTPKIFGEPQFEKPILFYEVLYFLFSFLGVNEFSARLGPLLAGLLGVILVYLWAKVLFKNESIALLSALILAVSAQYVVLSRIVLTDIFLSLFIAASLYLFSLFYKGNRAAGFWMFVALSLGFLTKGPVGVLFPAMGVGTYLFFKKDLQCLKTLPWMAGMIVFMVLGCGWYALMTWKYGVYFLEHFFVHENLRRFFVAEHKGVDRWHYYYLTILLGFLPWCVWVYQAVFSAFGDRGKLSGKNTSLLFLSFLGPFLLLTFAKSKLPTYVFPVFPFLALLTGRFLYREWRALNIKRFPIWKSSLVAGALVAAFSPFIFSACLMVYERRYDVDMSGFVGILCGITLIFGVAALLAFIKRRGAVGFGLLIAQMSIVYLVVFGAVLPSLDENISSREFGVTLNKKMAETPGSLWIASKMRVRGVRYYTQTSGPAYVFLNNRQKGFYTDHAVHIISSAEEIQSLLSKHGTLYWMVGQKEIKSIRERMPSTANLEILRENARLVLAQMTL